MKKSLVATLGLTSVAVTWWLAGRYSRAKAEVEARTSAGCQRMNHTKGPLEYAVEGEGIPVLVLHGFLGDYQHGLNGTRPLQNTGMMRIAVSRSGYQGTAAQIGGSASEQADCYAALLDYLDVERVVVLAISGAGPSALEFVRRYPERSKALIMIGGVSKALVFPKLRLLSLATLIYRSINSDVLMWLVTRAAAALMPFRLRLDDGLKARVLNNPFFLTMYLDIIKSYFPASPLRPGFENDVEQFKNLPLSSVSDIGLPVLVLHGRADEVVPFEHGEYTASQIAGAEFVPVDDGASHSFHITHHHKVWPHVIEFIREHGGG